MFLGQEQKILISVLVIKIKIKGVSFKRITAAAANINSCDHFYMCCCFCVNI